MVRVCTSNIRLVHGFYTKTEVFGECKKLYRSILNENMKKIGDEQGSLLGKGGVV